MDKTWDTEDPRNLPYRFAYSPITDEVFVIWLGFGGMKVSEMFENREAFHRFLVECNETDLRIADKKTKIIQEVEDILETKQED